MSVVTASESHERTFAYAMKAMAQARRFRTSIEPIAYEVWYEHVAGHHRALSAAVRALIAAGKLSDDDLRELHASHLSALRVSNQIGEIGAGAQAELANLIGTLRSALGDLGGIDDDLQRTADLMAKPGVRLEEVRSAVELAVAMTRQVCDTNRALKERLEASQSSIAALQTALATSRDAAMTDGLTELFNRRAFDEQLGIRFAKARADGVAMSVMMIDIDHFKRFNDTHGHPVGDQVIRLVGNCIRQRLGPADLPARYGGEEFAIISLGRRLREAREVAEDIRRKIDGYEIVQQGKQASLGKVTVSIGVAELRPSDSGASLVERADSCLYVAKRTGRNRVETDGPLRPELDIALRPTG